MTLTESTQLVRECIKTSVDFRNTLMRIILKTFLVLSPFLPSSVKMYPLTYFLSFGHKSCPSEDVMACNHQFRIFFPCTATYLGISCRIADICQAKDILKVKGI